MMVEVSLPDKFSASTADKWAVCPTVVAGVSLFDIANVTMMPSSLTAWSLSF